MRDKQSSSGGAGLERSCESWIASTRAAHGVELFRAWFAGEAYERHRHDTYAIGVTDEGVQRFDYRGAARTSLPGQVHVLYPDEPHDGRAGSTAGFGYRIVYVEPARLAAATRAIRGTPAPLPFVRDVVSVNTRLARAVDRAFDEGLEPLAVDALVLELAEGLIAGEGGETTASRADAVRVERAREFLDAERTRVVRSSELEAITGLTRYELARQFRTLLGTSPYRYLLMRRLEFARARIDAHRPLAEIAGDTGFADQAHFTRAFKAAFGLTPARYRSLSGSRAVRSCSSARDRRSDRSR